MQRLMLLIGILIVPLMAHAQEGRQPRDPGRATSDLIRIYGGNDDTEIGRRAEWAGKGEKSYADYLLAMAQQTLADEPHGRWVNDTLYPGYQATRERERLAQAVGSAAGSDASLDLVLWFIDNDPCFENVTRVAPALARIPAAAKPEILGRLIDHPNDAVATTAIAIAGSNRVAALAGPIAALTGNYRRAVREAARSQAEALHFSPLEYQPEKAFTPWLEKQLEIARSRVIVAIPQEAAWRQFTYADPRIITDKGPYVTKFGGWLLGQTDDAYHLVDWTGLERTLPKADTQVAERTLEEDAAALAAQRALTIGGRGGTGLTYYPEAAASAEFMVGAWLCERGNRAAGAQLLFPILNAVQDQRQALAQERDAMAHQYRAAMLWAFGGLRDYPVAARLAQHLGSDKFPGWALQAESRELAAQLALRGEDFVTLKLPSADEWVKLKGIMTRAQQVDYLAARLRIITNTVLERGSEGGRADYSGQQFAEAPARLRFGQGRPFPAVVINPYDELRAMKLQVAEVRSLLPRLLDEAFTLRHGPGLAAQGLPLLRVNQAVAEIVNGAAGQTLVDLQQLEPLDAAAKTQWLAKFAAWVDAHADRPRAALLLEVLDATKSYGDFFNAAQEMAVLQDKRATPIILQRFNVFSTDPQNQSSIAMLLYHLDPDASVTAARQWVKSPGYHLRFWAAMILVHSGNREAGEGWPELLGVLQEHDNNQYVPHAFDTLLASSRADARAFAVSELTNAEMMQWDGPPYVHRLLLAGRKEALDYELAQLDDGSHYYDAQGQYQGQQVTRKLIRGDNAAQILSGWRTDGYSYSTLAPDDVRRLERAKLKAWLMEQFVKIKAGKPSELAPVKDRLGSIQWNFPPE